MYRTCVLSVLLSSVMLIALPACRDDTQPPPEFNENLAQAGEPALLPLTPQDYPDGVRGRLVRMDRETATAGGESAAGGGAAATNPDVQDITGVIDDFNRLVRGGEYTSVAELVVADQHDDAMTYWSQLGELSLALHDALSQTTEAVGASKPELMPQVDALKATIDQITVRGITSPQVRVSGDQAVVSIEPPPPPGLGAPGASQIALRRGPDGWRFVAAVPEDGVVSAWVAPLRAALAATESAVNAFDSAQIDAQGLVTQLTAAATAVQTGETSVPAADESSASAAEEPAEEEPEPSAPPTRGGPAGLEP